MAVFWELSHIFAEEVIPRLFANKEKRAFLKYVPKRCRYCEVLGICRDEDNCWKCKRGCLIKTQTDDYEKFAPITQENDK